MALSLRDIAANFPGWTIGQCEAYMAGTKQTIYELPSRHFDEDLASFFYRGWADAAGSECEGEEWFDDIADWRIEERWWEDHG